MNANPDKPLMTQAQYARHRNNSPQYIGKLYKAGVLVMRGRLVEAVASDAVPDDKPVERFAPDSQQPPTRYAQAKLADMLFRALNHVRLNPLPLNGSELSLRNCAAWNSTRARVR